MAPKRPAAAQSGSASEASDAEADAPLRHPSSPSPSKTPPPPPNPNPKSSSAAAAPASAAEDSAAAGSDSAAAYDSDADHRPALRKPGASASPPRKRRSPLTRSRSRSPDAASDSDADPAAGDSADDGNASPLPPPRPSRPEAAAIKPLSSRPMDPPRRSMLVPSFAEPRPKRPRTAASVEQLKRPSRLWSPADELVILRGLATYRAKRGVLPGSMHDMAKLLGHIQGDLSVQVTPTQVSDKVRRLKQKYNLFASRAKNGRDPDLPTPHDHSVYEVSKRVWGAIADAGGGSTAGDGYEIGGGGGGESEEEREIAESDDDVDSGRDDRARKNRRLRPITMANGNMAGFGAVNDNSRGKFDFEKGKDAYPYLWETVEDLSKEHLNGVAFKKAFELIQGPKARGMEEKLRKFRLTEIRHQLRRMELMKETVKMVLDALEG
ncbi:hypothetical protein BAE44_0024831 [Dichanthelium oligosanthes]|uniref:Glabrous enhancer-binding protein-like DBD domain-containing protein n=1 Tax=Dichanthelium oligosanthes TaxID=888268 RepID=A0A1E5UMV7_9POAL|nr:hypothetical protein BAE44_0024831 [Dichanthelium oligosanthes]